MHFECPAQIDEDGKVTDTSLVNNKESCDGSTPGPSSAMKQQQSTVVAPAILMSTAQMPRSRSPSLLLIDEEPVIVVAALNERSQNEDEEIRRFENLLLDQPEVEEIRPPPSQDNLNENDLIE